MGVADHIWTHLSKSWGPIHHLSLANISVRGIRDIHASIPEMTIRESCYLIWWAYWPITCGAEFSELWVSTRKQRIVRSFIINYFQQKIMAQFYGKETQENSILDPFFPVRRTNNFPGKSAYHLSQLDFYRCAKC